MNISLILTLSDGTQQVHSYALPEGLTLTGYTVDVNGFPVAAPVVTDPVEKIGRNSMYGKTGAGKAADAEDISAQMAAVICGCMNPDVHRGGIISKALQGLPPNVFLFRRPATWPPRPTP